ncbi:MAG: hypothetical protein CMJ46_01020 [Planctomyces sp.]|nr:hypothetical protein [Planctomyces sp.]
MADKLNKKQKKHIDVIRTKIKKAEQLLAMAKKQPDDPAEIPRLQKEIEGYKKQIDDIQSSPS